MCGVVDFLHNERHEVKIPQIALGFKLCSTQTMPLHTQDTKNLVTWTLVIHISYLTEYTDQCVIMLF